MVISGNSAPTENAPLPSLTFTEMNEPTLTETLKTISEALYFFLSFLGGVYIGYLFGFLDGSNNG
jgi:hypothetical protein